MSQSKWSITIRFFFWVRKLRTISDFNGILYCTHITNKDNNRDKLAKIRGRGRTWDDRMLWCKRWPRGLDACLAVWFPLILISIKHTKSTRKINITWVRPSRTWVSQVWNLEEINQILSEINMRVIYLKILLKSSIRLAGKRFVPDQYMGFSGALVRHSDSLFSIFRLWFFLSS